MDKLTFKVVNCFDSADSKKASFAKLSLELFVIIVYFQMCYTLSRKKGRLHSPAYGLLC